MTRLTTPELTILSRREVINKVAGKWNYSLRSLSSRVLPSWPAPHHSEGVIQPTHSGRDDKPLHRDLFKQQRPSNIHQGQLCSKPFYVLKVGQKFDVILNFIFMVPYQ